MNDKEITVSMSLYAYEAEKSLIKEIAIKEGFTDALYLFEQNYENAAMIPDPQFLVIGQDGQASVDMELGGRVRKLQRKIMDLRKSGGK